MDLISVIIPVYKVEKYIGKCVDSVINQTYRNLEIFLVDDGSPDNCPAICDEYAQKDSRVKVLHKPNGGLSDARNAALDVMTGDYVAFVDSDDYLAPDAVEILYYSLKKEDADVSVGNVVSIDENGKEEMLSGFSSDHKVLTGSDVLSTINRPNAPSKLYKSEIYKNIRFPVGRLYEDVFVYHKVLAKTKKVVLTGKTVYYYLVRSGSIMHGDYNIRFTDIIDAIKERYEWLDSTGQIGLADEARLFIYSRTAVAYAHLDKNDPVHAARLEEIRKIYADCYKILIKKKSLSAKQKIRLWLLMYFPAVHTNLFGKKMPIALG